MDSAGRRISNSGSQGPSEQLGSLHCTAEADFVQLGCELPSMPMQGSAKQVWAPAAGFGVGNADGRARVVAAGDVTALSCVSMIRGCMGSFAAGLAKHGPTLHVASLQEIGTTGAAHSTPWPAQASI